MLNYSNKSLVTVADVESLFFLLEMILTGPLGRTV